MFQEIVGKTRKYGAAVTAQDALKCLAALLMTLDHIGALLDPDNLWWRAVGRACIPIWFFFLGYARPSAARPELYWLALVMVLADVATGRTVFPLNILVTILICRVVMNYMATRDRDLFMVALLTLLSVAVYMPAQIIVEYGTQLFPLCLAGYYCRVMPRHWLSAVTMALATAIYIAIQYDSFAFTPAQGVVMAAMVSLSARMMYRFQPASLPAFSAIPAVSLGLRVVGRNTQYYYVAHYLVLLVMATIIHPPLQPWHVVWFEW